MMLETYSFDAFTTCDLSDDAEAHAVLFERFGSDATPGVCSGEAFVDFELESPSLGAAVDVAVEALEALGAGITRIVLNLGAETRAGELAGA